MHRLIMDMPDISFDIDHRHGDETRNDNRKSNIRVVTKSQNSMNKKILKNNTSGVTGVGWDKESRKWIAYIAINKKQLTLGRFSNFEDAVSARKVAEKKYFGEFRYGFDYEEGA